MPEAICLHIQDRESGPIRVVEIPWISVRIGCAAFCEVRLAESQLADEACRLHTGANLVSDSTGLQGIDPGPGSTNRAALRTTFRRTLPRWLPLFHAASESFCGPGLGYVPDARVRTAAASLD